MSWLFSQALVEEYSAGSCSDGEPSAQLNVMPTQRPFWRKDKTTEFSSLSPFGVTSKHLTDARGRELLTSFLAAFPVRTSAPPEKAQESKGQDPGFGRTWRALSVKFDRDLSTWKIHHSLFPADLSESSVTLPRWGSMRDGELWERITSAPLMSAKGCGSWPTPTKSMGRRGFGFGKATKGRYKQEILNRYSEIGWSPSPETNEAVMGWPIHWTALKPLEMAKYQQWLQQHGKF